MLTLAIVTALGVSISASSLSDDNNSTKKEKTEKKEGKERRQQRKKDVEKGGFNPFDGIQLTAQQKEELAKLRPQKPQQDGNKEKGQRPEQLTPEQQKAKAAERLAQIKKILTPEQYQTYLENVAVGQMMHQGRPMNQGNRKKGNSGSRNGQK